MLDVTMGAKAAPVEGSPLSRREQLLAWVHSNPNLPSPPTIAMQVISKASDPDCEPDDLAALVARDPVLCAKILRTVNSALYAPRSPIVSVPAAVRVLGVHPLRSLVLAFTLSNVRFSPLPPEAVKTYWRVSVAGALAARALAVKAGRPSPDNDLVAGLVRDLGELVLNQVFPDDYPTILATSPEVLSGFQCELEYDLFGTTHAEATAELLGAWNLPSEITEPVRYHHDLEKASQLPGDLGERAQLLYLASQIGEMQRTPNRPMLVREVLRLSRQLVGMDEEALSDFLSPIESQMVEVASAMQVELGSGPAFSLVMSRGVEELARLAVTGSILRPPSLQPAAPAPPPTPKAPPAPPAPVAPSRSLLQRFVAPPATIKDGPATPPAEDNQDWAVAELQSRLFHRSNHPGTLGALDGYLVSELIGCGASGAVFRASDLRLQRSVAIKALLPNLAGNAKARARFLREGQAIANLSHENIVRIYAVGEVNDIPYLVMEDVRGGSLAQRLESSPLSLPAILRIGVDAAGGLAAAHAAGLVHRDIKPANLLQDEATGRVKVADFGLVHGLGESRLTQAGGLLGTPAFMSPEQADGSEPDARSDLFSLGCVLYVACTGNLPFPDESIFGVLKQVRELTPPPICKVNSSLPAWLEEIVAGLLTKSPERRFPPAAELKRLFLCRWANLYTHRRVVVPRGVAPK